MKLFCFVSEPIGCCLVRPISVGSHVDAMSLVNSDRVTGGEVRVARLAGRRFLSVGHARRRATEPVHSLASQWPVFLSGRSS